MGIGINTAALAFGGFTSGPPGTVITGATETWNGTSWTEVNDMNTARGTCGSSGTNTAGLTFGGIDGSLAILGNTESWNGTSWTEVNDLNTARRDLAGAGTQTAALGFGGNPTVTAATESWNGTSWSQADEMNTARRQLAGAGTQTLALAFGGGTPAKQAQPKNSMIQV
jgi:hypothetical protein